GAGRGGRRGDGRPHGVERAEGVGAGGVVRGHLHGLERVGVAGGAGPHEREGDDFRLTGLHPERAGGRHEAAVVGRPGIFAVRLGADLAPVPRHGILPGAAVRVGERRRLALRVRPVPPYRDRRAVPPQALHVVVILLRGPRPPWVVRLRRAAVVVEVEDGEAAIIRRSEEADTLRRRRRAVAAQAPLVVVVGVVDEPQVPRRVTPDVVVVVV